MGGATAKVCGLKYPEHVVTGLHQTAQTGFENRFQARKWMMWTTEGIEVFNFIGDFSEEIPAV